MSRLRILPDPDSLPLLDPRYVHRSPGAVLICTEM